MREVTLNREHLLELGNEFEKELLSYLKIKFPSGKYLHNLNVYSAFLGKTTQIDLIFITYKCIYVIEAKNWIGFIEGGYNDEHWSGKSRANLIMTVFNPVNQNNIHIRTVRNALRLRGINPPKFHNIVVVPDGTAIRSTCREVINKSKLIPTINRYEKQSHYNLNPTELYAQIREVCN